MPHCSGRQHERQPYTDGHTGGLHIREVAVRRGVHRHTQQDANTKPKADATGYIW